jgi:isocitrate lyase
MLENSSPSLLQEWRSSPRWRGIRRDYPAEDVRRLRPQVLVEHTLARVGAERLWRLLGERDHVSAP